MRLFVALELAAQARAALGDWQHSAEVRELSGLRLVAPESLHLTLCFLGQQPDAAVGALSAAVGTLAGTGPCRLALDDPHWLPRRRPRVLAAGLADVDGHLEARQASLLAALGAAVGFKAQTRPFFPHVSVARVARGARVAARPLDGPAPVAFSGSRVVLVQSLLGRGPARYEELAAVLL